MQNPGYATHRELSKTRTDSKAQRYANILGIDSENDHKYSFLSDSASPKVDAINSKLDRIRSKLGIQEPHKNAPETQKTRDIIEEYKSRRSNNISTVKPVQVQIMYFFIKIARRKETNFLSKNLQKDRPATSTDIVMSTNKVPKITYKSIKELFEPQLNGKAPPKVITLRTDFPQNSQIIQQKNQTIIKQFNAQTVKNTLTISKENQITKNIARSELQKFVTVLKNSTQEDFDTLPGTYLKEMSDILKCLQEKLKKPKIVF